MELTKEDSLKLRTEIKNHSSKESEYDMNRIVDLFL
jgi:hypothetical protein